MKFLQKMADSLVWRILGHSRVLQNLDESKLRHGTMLTWMLKHKMPHLSLRASEFKVFSQHGEDGVIQYLLHLLPGIPDTFIEFGVQDYSESNTRFLLMHDNWRGLVIDGDAHAVNQIRKSYYYWQHDLTAVHHFIMRESILPLIESNGFSENIGILSVDIDGNDYWILETIIGLKPAVLVVEYNSLFGPSRPISIPYQADFERYAADCSGLYFGASLSAFCHLASQHDYALVGCGRDGTNAFFVRRDLLPPCLSPMTAAEAYVQTRIRQGKDKSGNLTFDNFESQGAHLQGMPVVDVTTGRQDCL